MLANGLELLRPASWPLLLTAESQRRAKSGSSFDPRRIACAGDLADSRILFGELIFAKPTGNRDSSSGAVSAQSRHDSLRNISIYFQPTSCAAAVSLTRARHFVFCFLETVPPNGQHWRRLCWRQADGRTIGPCCRVVTWPPDVGLCWARLAAASTASRSRARLFQRPLTVTSVGPLRATRIVYQFECCPLSAAEGGRSIRVAIGADKNFETTAAARHEQFVAFQRQAIWSKFEIRELRLLDC
jgi:hypothetical protein